MSQEKPTLNIHDGWFLETSTMWPGQAMGYKVKQVEFCEKTEFQDLAVFENDGPWGTVMTLDGAVQVTDKDEFVYHEMMAHVPLTIHPNPKTVLIIGGGDGGVMREVLKHPMVERCDLVDIDGAVIEQSKKYFPEIAVSFQNPKANVTVGDGLAFVATKTEEYDVIIVDSSDPEGPASVLFGAEFYNNVKRALKPQGVVCSQGESLWLHKPIIEKMANFLKVDIKFDAVKYGMIYIPSYPCGSIGCMVASKGFSQITEPLNAIENSDFAKDLKYYDSNVHKAAFALPRFASELNQ